MKNKFCNKCKQTKSILDFNKNKTKKDGVNSNCTECQRKYTKSHYYRNQKYYKVKARKNANRIKAEVFKFLIEYCESHPCKCGEKDFVVLEFNHKDRNKKVDNISSMVGDGKPIEEIKKELKKCEVMCSNCHKRHTAKQMQWYKYL